MSPNERFVQEGFAAFNRGDREAWLGFVAPDAVFYTAGLFPDFGEVFRGRDGFAEFWDRFHEPFDELRAEIEHIEDEGDAVAVDLRYSATRAGAPPVELVMGAAMRTREGLGVVMVSGATGAEAVAKLRALDAPSAADG